MEEVKTEISELKQEVKNANGKLDVIIKHLTGLDK